jgi:hypothetical protein
MSLTMTGLNAVAKKAVMFVTTGEAAVYSPPSRFHGITSAKRAMLREYLPVAVAPIHADRLPIRETTPLAVSLDRSPADFHSGLER